MMRDFIQAGRLVFFIFCVAIELNWPNKTVDKCVYREINASHEEKISVFEQ